MNPIITEMYHELSELRKGSKHPDEIKLKEKNGELYYQFTMGKDFFGLIRLFCKNDRDRELSIVIYMVNREVVDRKEALRKINKLNGGRNRWFRLCLTQKNEIFLRRDTDYESAPGIIEFISCGLDMVRQELPHFDLYAENRKNRRGK